MPNYYGQKVDTSNSNGLGVQAAWCKLFDDNERMYSVGIMPKSDDTIVAQMKVWFPKRQSVELMREAKWWRARYNRGLLTRGDIPRIKSYRYMVVSNCIIRFHGNNQVASTTTVKGMQTMEEKEKEQQQEQDKKKQQTTKRISKPTEHGNTKLVDAGKIKRK